MMPVIELRFVPMIVSDRQKHMIDASDRLADRVI